MFIEKMLFFLELFEVFFEINLLRKREFLLYFMFFLLRGCLCSISLHRCSVGGLGSVILIVILTLSFI